MVGGQVGQEAADPPLAHIAWAAGCSRLEAAFSGTVDTSYFWKGTAALLVQRNKA
jgi:hypothetical protein